MYTVTYMANKLGISTGDVQRKLVEWGLQRNVKIEDSLPGQGQRTKWTATEAGLKVSEIRKGNKGAIPYEILVWDETVFDRLGFVRPPDRTEFDMLVQEVRALKLKLTELGLGI